MAFKLTKDEQATIQTKLADVAEAGEAIDAAEKAYNDALEGLGDAVKTAVETYNTALGDLRTCIEEIAQEKRDEFDEKSEKYQEGENGQKVGRWVETLEERATELDDIEAPEGLDPLAIDRPTLDDYDVPSDPDSV